MVFKNVLKDIAHKTIMKDLRTEGNPSPKIGGRGLNRRSLFFMYLCVTLFERILFTLLLRAESLLTESAYGYRLGLPVHFHPWE